jgi:hypothetical protein
VTVGEMEVLLKVGRFNMDRSVQMTMIQAHINVQKCDFGGVLQNHITHH